MRRARWRLKKPCEADALAGALGVPPVVARLLAVRGMEDPDSARAYMEAPLSSMEDPLRMADMDRAVERIVRARARREKIVVYADYDVDGITAAAALIRFFRETGFTAGYYIPERLSEGYGLNTPAVERIAGEGAGLVITVDSGISGHAAVERANALGLDVIVTDHHQPGMRLPPAYAVLNPRRKDCPYPFKTLAGAGVAMKLLMALRSRLHEEGMGKAELPNLRKYLDLIALGTIADMVPLTGENRVMARHGLAQLSTTDKPGLAALARIALRGGGPVTARDAAFSLAPVLNAAGRLGRADTALNLLTTEDEGEARKLAAFLEGENLKRREAQREMFEQAVRMAEKTVDFARERIIVVGDEGWFSGVAGIVASKLVNRYHMPAAVVCFKDGVGTGSARSIHPFNITEGLGRASGALERYGGHRLAAGFTVRREKFAELKEALAAAAGDDLSPEDLVPEVEIDLAAEPSDFDMETVEALSALEPFGEGAPAPVFLSRGVAVKELRRMGREGASVRLSLDGGVEAVGFGMAELFAGARGPQERFDIVYTPEINAWGSSRRPRLRLIDARGSC
ncbi:MAG: single-stranded-DNA-specific exonuclease RecJ [Candidatus Nitrospinota bacterium M3_3B_026]